jgi:beta-lactamase superfamily II metal-dependent hydrolase
MNYIKSVERIFWPVGQGAFYSEKLKFDDGKEFNIVYDCGSNNKKPLEKSINNFNSKTIDILFISHFHNDHISGIEKLLQKSEIKMIIIPYLLKEEVIIEVSNSLVHSNYESIKFLNYCYYDQLKNYEYLQNYTFPEETIEKLNNIKIIKKYPDNDEENRKEYFFREGIDFSDLLDYKIEVYDKKPLKININKSISKSSKNAILWVYSLYNHKNNEYYSKISSKLKEKDIDILIPENYKENIDKIIDVYKEYFENLNDSSMFLYSGKEKINIRKITICFDRLILNEKKYKSKVKNFKTLKHLNQNERLYFLHKRIKKLEPNNGKHGCLYTGDGNIKKENLNIQKIYKRYWKNIYIIQIPHHGSKNNYNYEFSEEKNMNFIVSSGTNYKNHPDESIAKSLNENNNFYNVTENPSSQKIFIKKTLDYLNIMYLSKDNKMYYNFDNTNLFYLRKWWVIPYSDEVLIYDFLSMGKKVIINRKNNVRYYLCPKDIKVKNKKGIFKSVKRLIYKY